MKRFCYLGPKARGAGLAGYRVGRVLPGTQHDELLRLRLSGGVPDVGWLMGWESGRGCCLQDDG